MKKTITLGFAVLSVATPVVVAVSCGEPDLSGVHTDDDITEGLDNKITKDIYMSGTQPGGVFVTLDVSNGVQNFTVDKIVIDGHILEANYAQRRVPDPRNPRMMIENPLPLRDRYREFWDAFENLAGNEWTGWYEGSLEHSLYYSIRDEIIHVNRWGSFVDPEFTEDLTGVNDEFEEGFTEAIWQQGFNRIPHYDTFSSEEMGYLTSNPYTDAGIPDEQVVARWEAYIYSKITIDTSGMTDHKDWAQKLQALIDRDYEAALAKIDHQYDALLQESIPVYGPVEDYSDLIVHSNEDSRIKPYTVEELYAARNEWYEYCNGLNMPEKDKQQMKDAIEFIVDKTPSTYSPYGLYPEYRGAVDRNGNPYFEQSDFEPVGRKFVSADPYHGHAWIKHGGFEGLTLPSDFYIPSVVEETGRDVFRDATLPVGFEVPSTIEIIHRWTFRGAKLADGYEVPNMDTAIAFHMGNNFNQGEIGSLNFNGATLPDDFNFNVSPARNKNMFISNIPANIFSGFTIPQNYIVNTYNDLIKLQNGGIPHSGTNGEGTLKLSSNFSIPSNVTGIPSYAFKQVTIPSGFGFSQYVKNIGAYAFQDAKLPMNFAIPANITMVSNSSFVGADVPSGYFADEHTYQMLKFGGCTDTDLVAPSADWEENMARISTKPGQYEGQVLPAGFKLPDETRYIAPRTFKGATLPEGFTLPEGVLAIGDEAFAGITGFVNSDVDTDHDGHIDDEYYTEDADNDGRVGEQEHHALEANGRYKENGLPDSFRLPDSLTFIGDQAFYESNLNEGFTLENTHVEYIGRLAFWAAGVTYKEIEYVDAAGAFRVQHFVMPDNFALPDTLVTVDSAAFQLVCFMPGFTIPSSLVNFEKQSFNSTFTKTSTYEFQIPRFADYGVWNEDGVTGHASPFDENRGVPVPISGTGLNEWAFYNQDWTGRHAAPNYIDLSTNPHREGKFSDFSTNPLVE